MCIKNEVFVNNLIVFYIDWEDHDNHLKYHQLIQLIYLVQYMVDEKIDPIKYIEVNGSSFKVNKPFELNKSKYADESKLNFISDWPDISLSNADKR